MKALPLVAPSVVAILAIVDSALLRRRIRGDTDIAAAVQLLTGEMTVNGVNLPAPADPRWTVATHTFSNNKERSVLKLGEIYVDVIDKDVFVGVGLALTDGRRYGRFVLPPTKTASLRRQNHEKTGHSCDDDNGCCRRLADRVCPLCEGDFCDHHFKPMLFAQICARRLGSPQPGQAPFAPGQEKYDTHSAAEVEIRICDRCYGDLNRARSILHRERREGRFCSRSSES